MERNLQHCWVEGLLFVAVFAAACGPIEPEPLDPGSPYIDPNKVNPDRQSVQVRSNTTIEVSTLYDPNQHPNLEVVWMSDERGFLRRTTVPRTGTTDFQGNRFYTYQGVEENLDPCEFDQQRDETLWLFVSDLGFSGTTDQSIELADGAFLTSRAWNIEYFPVNCDR
jgi:hypothetical protein